MFNLPNKLRVVPKFIRDQPKPLRQNRVRIAAHSPSMLFILFKFEKNPLKDEPGEGKLGAIMENELNHNHLIYMRWFSCNNLICLYSLG